MGRKILITGANGTVGEAAGDYLCDKGYEVVGVSRDIEKTDCYTDVESIDLIDEANIEKLVKAMDEVDAVFHLAWNVSAENFNTGEAWEPNMVMFENVMEAARRADVPIFINGSSIHAGTGDIPAYTVEGSLEKTPEPYRGSIDQDSSFDLRKKGPSKLLDPREENPDSPYGWSKVMTERATREAVQNGDFGIGASIRIGGVNPEDSEKLEGESYYSSLYWSHRDLGRTIENILTADLEEKEGYHQFYGVSDNEGRVFDIKNTFTSGESKQRFFEQNLSNRERRQRLGLGIVFASVAALNYWSDYQTLAYLFAAGSLGFIFNYFTCFCGTKKALRALKDKVSR